MKGDDFPDGGFLDEQAAFPGIYTVTQLTSEIKTILEEGFADVRVTGEISNYKAGPSGHAYFSLKDEGALLSCVIWRSTLANMKNARFSDGVRVVATGRITVYPPRGQYQLVVTRMEAGGLGELQRRFEELKQKLFEEGLFDDEHKIPIPSLPQSVAVITSPTGAAIRDFLNVLGERYPGARVIIYPVRVQGAGSAQEIAAAIATANRRRDVDVIVLTRGGGSLEDLWSFNEEIVARAIHASELPLISAVGHEIDFTISDLVADLRAPTPTAAAMVVARNRIELSERLAEMKRRLMTAFDNSRLLLSERVDSLHETILRHSPLYEVEEYRRRIDDCLILASTRARNYLVLRRSDLASLNRQLPFLMSRELERRRSRLENLSGRLAALAPESPLQRGYAIVTRRDNRQVVSDPNEVTSGSALRIRIKKGEFNATVD